MESQLEKEMHHDPYAVRSDEYLPDTFWDRFLQSIQSDDTIRQTDYGCDHVRFYLKGKILPDETDFQICAPKKGGYSIVGDYEAARYMKAYIDSLKSSIS